MYEKTEWELVDEPASQQAQGAYGQRAASGDPAADGMSGVMRALMGRWWRWKIFGGVVFAVLAVALIAMLTGVFALIAASAGALALGIAKVRQWARRHNGALTSR